MIVRTAWEVWTYDVWGNEEDGFEVNDRSCIDRCLEVNCAVIARRKRAGEEERLKIAEPSDVQIRDAFDIKPGVWVDIDGDDTHIYVTLENGYPVGEMLCMSHDSLSPIGPELGEWDDNDVFYRRYPDPPPHDAATATGMYDMDC